MKTKDTNTSEKHQSGDPIPELPIAFRINIIGDYEAESEEDLVKLVEGLLIKARIQAKIF